MNDDQKSRLAVALRILRELQYEFSEDGWHQPTMAERARAVQDAIDSLEAMP